MTGSLQTVFLYVLALFVCAIAVNSVRTGEVAWRGGTVAARRREEPVLFWVLVALQFAVACVICWRAAL
jgi:hypothetical protein